MHRTNNLNNNIFHKLPKCRYVFISFVTIVTNSNICALYCEVLTLTGNAAYFETTQKREFDQCMTEPSLIVIFTVELFWSNNSEKTGSSLKKISRRHMTKERESGDSYPRFYNAKVPVRYETSPILLCNSCMNCTEFNYYDCQ